MKHAPEILAALTSRPTPPSTVVRRKHSGKSTGIKSTNAQIAERVMLTAKLLIRGALKSQIHEVIGARYHVHWRTTDNYIARARELLLSEVQKTRTDLVSESYGLYRSVLSDPNASVSDKIRAQQCIDDLLALHAPRTQRTELSGQNGEPLSTGMVQQVVFCIADNHRGDRAGAGHGAPPASALVAVESTSKEPELEDDLEDKDSQLRGTIDGVTFLQQG